MPLAFSPANKFIHLCPSSSCYKSSFLLDITSASVLLISIPSIAFCIFEFEDWTIELPMVALEVNGIVDNVTVVNGRVEIPNYDVVEIS